MAEVNAWSHRCPGPPPLHNVDVNKILVETLNGVANPTRCRQPKKKSLWRHYKLCK